MTKPHYLSFKARLLIFSLTFWPLLAATAIAFEYSGALTISQPLQAFIWLDILLVDSLVSWAITTTWEAHVRSVNSKTKPEQTS